MKNQPWLWFWVEQGWLTQGTLWTGDCFLHLRLEIGYWRWTLEAGNYKPLYLFFWLHTHPTLNCSEQLAFVRRLSCNQFSFRNRVQTTALVNFCTGQLWPSAYNTVMLPNLNSTSILTLQWKVYKAGGGKWDETSRSTDTAWGDLRFNFFPNAFTSHSQHYVQTTR